MICEYGRERPADQCQIVRRVEMWYTSKDIGPFSTCIATSQARVFTYARRCGKDPGWSWSRDSFKNLLLYRVGKVSNYMLPHTSDTFQMQGARFNCYERQYELFDLKLSIFVCFVVSFTSFNLFLLAFPKARVSISSSMLGVGNCQAIVSL